MLYSFSVYAISRVLPSLSSFIFTMICVEKLAATEYATYSLLLIPIMLVSSFTGGLAGQPMMRFATVLTSDALQIGLFRIPCLSAALLSLILVVYMAAMKQTLAVMAIAVGLVFLFSIIDVRRSYYIAFSRPFDVFALDATRSITGLVVLYALMNYGYTGSNIPLVALLVGNTAALLLVSLRYKQQQSQGNTAIDRGYLRYGFWVASWMVMIGLFPMLERVIIVQNEGLSVTGVYAAIADPLVAAISAFGAILVSVLMPRFVASWNVANHAEIRKLTRIGVLATVAFTFFCLLLGMLLMNFGTGRFVTLLKQNQLLAFMILVSMSILLMGIFFHKPLELKNETHIIFLYLAFSLAVFVICAELLVSRFGMLGVAFSKIFAAMVYVMLLKRRTWI